MKEIKCGLLGKDLKHSYSQEIHENLFLEYKETFKNDFLDSSNDIGLNYKLIFIEENELESFLKKRDFDYLNVTIPYKQKIMKYLDSISIEAQEINAVNLIINKNGILTGYNTDSYGFEKSLERNKIELSNYHNCLILGTGGAQKAVYYTLKEKNQIEMNISLASRQENKQYLTYEEVKEKCEKFDFVVNCTPVGMYPLINSEIIDINTFKNVKLVYDLVYNPLNTLLIQKAKKRNIKTINGLEMLVYQAMKTLNIFFNLEDNNQNNQDFEKIFTKVYDYLLSKQNIVLIGMPGSGKSTIGKILSKNINEFIINKFILNNYEKCFSDIDEEIIKVFGNIDDLFHNPSIKEEGFRKIEKRYS